MAILFFFCFINKLRESYFDFQLPQCFTATQNKKSKFVICRIWSICIKN